MVTDSLHLPILAEREKKHAVHKVKDDEFETHRYLNNTEEHSFKHHGAHANKATT